MKVKTVLFICVHNSGRSQMAEAFLNKLAEERNLPMRAISAGTLASSSLNPVVVESLREIGISMDGMKPKRLTQEMADSADRIITMGCGVDAEACPARILVTEDWGLDDPAGQPLDVVRAIRDQVRTRVDMLVNEILKADNEYA